MSVETHFQYISHFDTAVGQNETPLDGSTPRDLEQEEFLYIQARRIKAYTGLEFDPLREFGANERNDRLVRDATDWLKPQKQHDRNLVGLAFSGGGIRSATFALGVLQGLAELDVLKNFDYLSTVSGGGFIGSWLAAWIKREGGVVNVEKQLKPQRVDQADGERGFGDQALKQGRSASAEPEPIFHLREFSNYLSPRLSFFSGDSWTLVAIYIRNLLANLLVLLPFVTAVLLLTRLYLVLLASKPPLFLASDVQTAGIVTILVTLAIGANAYKQGRRGPFAVSIGACGVFSIIAAYWFALKLPGSVEPHLIAIFGPPAVVLVLGLIAFLSVILRGRMAQEPEREWLARFGAWLLLIAICWIGVFGISLYGTLWIWRAGFWLRTALTAGWITSAIAGVNAARSAKTSGHSRVDLVDVVAIVGPIVFLIGLGCALSLGMSELIPLISSKLQWPATNHAAGPVVIPVSDLQRKPAEAAGKPAPAPDGKTPDTKGGTRSIAQNTADVSTPEEEYWKRARTADPRHLLFALAGALLTSVFFAWRVDINEFSLNAMYANRIARCYLGGSRRKTRADTRGAASRASGRVRSPNAVTGFDPFDDFDLNDLRIGVVPDPNLEGSDDADRSHAYWGPFPLINTALNLVASDQLAWQERKAESFVLSPLYCGGDSVGYRDTCRYSAGLSGKRRFWKGKPLTLGRAVAISGAAANPNMGYHSSPAPAALMTIFNVRLGWWLPNPRRETGWMSSGPQSGLAWMLCELFGFTDARRDYVNISDGGHFDNLGVYELIRRRCRFIVVADAGADPNFEFADLAGLIRKCRTDFGIEIEIDVSRMRRRDGKHGDVHCAIGTIRYDQVEPTAPLGTMVYLKPSLTGDEPTDIQHYAGKHPDFPHQPTLNQFFNESQFESYRALGYHCATQVMYEAVEPVKKGETLPDAAWLAKNKDNLDVVLSQTEECHTYATENLFYFLRKQWLTVPFEFEAGFLKSVEGFQQLQQDLALDPSTAEISSLYPELAADPREGVEPTPKRSFPKGTPKSQATLEDGRPANPHRTIELHTASRMLQVMENTWLSLRMDRFYGHPLNSGWMSVFQRWGNWPPLMRYWPLLRNEYSRDFVRFCEHKLALKSKFSEELLLVRDLKKSAEGRTAWSQICAEFDREWPNSAKASGRCRLDRFYKEAWRFPDKAVVAGDDHSRAKEKGKRAFYYLRVSPNAADENLPGNEGFIGGIVGLRPIEKEAYLKSKRKSSLDEREVMKECQDHVLWSTDLRVGYELLVWVRPSYRQGSIGTVLLQRMMSKLERQPYVREMGQGKKVRISVLYPQARWWRKVDDLEKTMWLNFFSFYGFRRPPRGCPHCKDYEVLSRDLSCDG